MCCMYRKRSELFSLISTALFVALNTEGPGMCFNSIVDTPPAHRILLFKAMSNQPC